MESARIAVARRAHTRACRVSTRDRQAVDLACFASSKSSSSDFTQQSTSIAERVTRPGWSVSHVRCALISALLGIGISNRIGGGFGNRIGDRIGGGFGFAISNRSGPRHQQPQRQRQRFGISAT